MSNVKRNKEREITHILMGIWEGEKHYLSTKKSDEVRSYRFSEEDMEKADTDSSDSLIIDLMNGDSSVEEIKFNICRQLGVFSTEDVIIEKL